MHHLARGALPRIVLVIATSMALPVCAQTLTLDEARRLALEASPALKSAQAGRLAAQGQLAESGALLWNNPTLNIEPLRRTAPQAGAATLRYGEWSAGLAQTFELAGQRSFRLAAAQQDLASLDAALGELRKQLYAEVEERFVRVLALQRRAALETENLGLVESAAAAMNSRVTAGESSRLEGNLARVEAERTRNQLDALGEQLLVARAELAQLLQLAPERLPEAAGEIARPAVYDKARLVEQAQRRPQLVALERREAAARNRLSLERASATPDVTVGVNLSRDGPGDLREHAIGLSVSLPLPFYRRNEAAIGKAASELTQVQIERRAFERDAVASTLAHWARYERLRERSARLKASVLPPLEENLRLSQGAFRAGEIGLAEILLVNRQVLEGRRDALEAETELRLAQVALERAAGWNE